MDIQWVILARGWRINENGTMDIAQIFNSIDGTGSPYVVSFHVLAKVVAEPTEVGIDKILTLELRDKSGKLIESLDCKYNIPDLNIWAKSTPFVSFDIDNYGLKDAGEYSFDIVIDGETKNREWFIIRDKRKSK
jgi:hypothetical protein